MFSVSSLRDLIPRKQPKTSGHPRSERSTLFLVSPGKGRGEEQVKHENVLENPPQAPAASPGCLSKHPHPAQGHQLQVIPSSRGWDLLRLGLDPPEEGGREMLSLIRADMAIFSIMSLVKGASSLPSQPRASLGASPDLLRRNKSIMEPSSCPCSPAAAQRR